MKLSNLLHILDALLYPRRTLCLCCGRLSHDEALCSACQSALEQELLDGLRCPLCDHAVHSSYCSFCRGEVPGPMRSAWRHQGVPRKLVHHLKYECVADCAPILAQGMTERAQEFHLPANTVVTWVTMPRSRLVKRGIDHSRLLAEAVARELHLPCRQLLIRTGKGHTQRGLSRADRLRNLTGCFSCPDTLNHPVLLVDDVLTTSATVRICAAVLLQAGATQVYVITATQA